MDECEATPSSSSPPNDADVEVIVAGVTPNIQEVTTFHLPDFVLKIDTNDCYSTHSALKKKQCSTAEGKTIRLEDIPGVRRFGKNPARPFMFVYFDSSEAMHSAIPLFEQRVTKGKNWACKACTADDANRALGLDKRAKGQKRPAETIAEGEGAPKKSKTLEETVTCYAHLPYEEQLQLKHKHVQRTLKSITVSALKPWAEERRRNNGLVFPEWITEANAKQGGLCCEAEPVIPTPQIAVNGYRNNTSFTCGYDEEGKDAVGFMLGLYKEGLVAVGHPYKTKHISDLSKHYCAVFQNFINRMLAQGHRCYDKCNHSGIWRRLVVRETVDRDVMFLVQYKPPASWDDSARAELHKSLVDLFTTAAATEHLDVERPHQLKSIHVQEYDGISNAAPPNLPYNLIHGEPFILEACLGLKFRIRPTSFFQVNTLANEELIKLIRQMGAIDKSTLVLDLCCGTGTIGISLAPHCAKVFGVDMVSDAIADARDNCTLNGIENATYICDKIESSRVASDLDDVMASFDAGKVVAICDPPRCGLHNKFLQWLRGATQIQRMIYVSCDQSSLIRDAFQLAKSPSKQYSGPPFAPVAARGIDLFPHTDLCEVVVAWTRISEVPTQSADSQSQEKEELQSTATDGSGSDIRQPSNNPTDPILQPDLMVSCEVDGSGSCASTP